ncbi:hypothetical protein Scep_022954 [Stephania cephalantha]|uniref:Uncharacterized protein n=1 Tax=Stephania cephalantha TaxID=152367 RepID=A0AAP0I2N3_9MAGN
MGSQKYGIPIYGASWIPKQNRFEEETESTHQQQSPSSSSPLLVFCGGGGEGRSGIPNSLLIAQFDSNSSTLSPDPVAKLGTGDDLPYRMAVHPGGQGLICSFSKSCRWFEWDEQNSAKSLQLGLKSSEKVLTQLEDVGQQLALTFNHDGSILAVGGEDGHLRVFKWPNMDIILDEGDAHSTVKDLSFSFDGKLLVSLGRGGPPRVWDVESSKVVASLSKENPPPPPSHLPDQPPKRGRGRPPKSPAPVPVSDGGPPPPPGKRGRGRPPKAPVEEISDGGPAVVPPVIMTIGRQKWPGPPRRKAAAKRKRKAEGAAAAGGGGGGRGRSLIWGLMARLVVGAWMLGRRGRWWSRR